MAFAVKAITGIFFISLIDCIFLKAVIPSISGKRRSIRIRSGISEVAISIPSKALVAEKKVISNNATVGIYYWKQGKDYVKYAKQMIKKNLRINNEFYVCPVFNEALKENKNILIDKIDKMWGIGTPEDLKYFIDNFKVK